MAFPNVSQIADFSTYSDEDPLSHGGNWANWTVANGPLKALGGAVFSPDAAGTMYYTPSLFNAAPIEVAASVGFGTASANWVLGLCLSSPGSDSFSGYLLNVGNDAGVTDAFFQIYRYDTGTPTLLSDIHPGFGVTAGHIIGLALSGGNLISYFDSTVIDTKSDSNYTSGYAGMGIVGTAPRFLTFYAGSVGSYSLSLGGESYIASGSDLTLASGGPVFTMRFTH